MALTDVAIRNAKPGAKASKLADGNGLFLLVTPAGGKLYRLKFRIDGREKVRARLPYFNRHSFRDTLVQLGEQTCQTVEQFKAWSQNLGHDRVMTTLTSYGNVAPHRQAELIRGMGAAKGAVGQLARSVDPALVVQVLAALQNMPR